jgi:hypothetical protein
METYVYVLWTPALELMKSVDVLGGMGIEVGYTYRQFVFLGVGHPIKLDAIDAMVSRPAGSSAI